IITVEDLTVADDFLLKFCKAFERLYGSDEVTPNIHLHCQLINCVKQYGPIYGFWLFSFERYSGMLERMPTNKKDIEIQLMRRFERDLQAQNIPFPEIFKEEFLPLFGGIQNSVQRGSLGMIGSDVQTLLMSSKKTNYSGPLPWSDLSNIQLKRNPTIYQLTPREIECLESMYKSLYPEENINVPSASKSLEVVCNGVLYGSVTSRSIRASNVTAYWRGVDGNIQSFAIMYHSARPGKILFFETFCRIRWTIRRSCSCSC
uniref:Uncharacterized protein n=1 Tax=Clytia hemisphaerica TaxID=252671 RepID=A0A7M6DRQ1_9CNID